MNLDLSERRNVSPDVSQRSCCQQQQRTRTMDISGREQNVYHQVFVDISERSRVAKNWEGRTSLSPITTTKVRAQLERNGSRRSFLLIFVSFLCGMRLSFEFANQYVQFLSSSSSSSAVLATTPDYSTVLYETIRQEAERTTTFLRDTVGSIQESTTAIATGSEYSQLLVSAVSNTLVIDTNRTYSDYAFAFVIGGCDPSNPSYRGFIYNILVSTRLLRDQGSTNDVVVFIQLTFDYTGGTTLPEVDVMALDGLNIHVYYIPPSQYESFYETVMNKFRVLQLVQYRRVILMDGDVMPMSNLDFLFELSDDNAYGPGNSTLKENLVVAGPWEPANAGFFMLAPAEGDYELICQIIEKREERVKLKPDVLFDEHEGWGHIIEVPDEWVARKSRGMNWTFHFAFSDQGLLYHWTKYVKKSVSIVFHNRVENLSDNGSGTPQLEREMHNVFVNYSKPLISQFAPCNKFMCDYHHFTGVLKPWLRKPPEDLSEATKLTSGTYIWWYYLKMVDQDLSLHLNFDVWVSPGRPTHGLFATWGDMMKKESFKRGNDSPVASSDEIT